MRNAAAFLIGAALLGLGAPAPEASAGATVDLLFVGVNSSPIAPTASLGVGAGVAAGDAVTMAVLLRNDQPLTVAIFSLGYDLGGGEELSMVSAFQWQGLAISRQGTDFFAPITSLPSPTDGLLGSFQGVTTNFDLPRPLPPAGGVFAGGYQIGTIVWRVGAGVATDGADVLSGLLNVGVDGFGDAGFNDLAALLRFDAASVNAVPEPAAASLLALGLLGLALAGRRRSRS